MEAMQVMGLETNQNWTDMVRRRKERDWILKLNTSYPKGLNERNGTII